MLCKRPDLCCVLCSMLASPAQAGRARALCKAGLRSAQAVAEASSREIAKIISSWGRGNSGGRGCILDLYSGAQQRTWLVLAVNPDSVV